MAETAGVRHHMALRRRGGAAGVARTLAGLQQEARPVSLSYELDEPGPDGDAFYGERCAPADLAGTVPPGGLIHVHATLDWHALLRGFAASPRPLVVTVHDCSLITGGCVYPVFCSHHAKACQDPCPRDYPESMANRALKRELVARARPVLASPSSWLAGMLRREWPDIPVKVIPNGVAVPAVLPDKATARSRLGIAAGARVALFLAHGGVKASYKGGDRFQAIIHGLSKTVDGLLGIVAGGGETRREGGTLYFPYVEGGALGDLLSASDVLVYPSLADNHPLVILEAMARGLPVAAYAVGGVPEQVVDGGTGLLARVKDEEGLTRSAARILSDPSLARSMASKARDRAVRHFGAERMAESYLRLYERLAAGRP